MPSIRQIAEAVAKEGGYTFEDFKRPARTARLAHWRHLAFYIARTHTKQSYPVIGRYFDRDHTTIIHGVRCMRKLIATDFKWQARLDRLHEILGAPKPETWIEDVAQQVAAALAVKAEMEATH